MPGDLSVPNGPLRRFEQFPQGGRAVLHNSRTESVLELDQGLSAGSPETVFLDDLIEHFRQTVREGKGGEGVGIGC